MNQQEETKMKKNLKRALACMLAVVMVLCAVPMSSSAVNTEGYYSYIVTDGEATITDVDTSISGDVVIPDTLGGYQVTSIADGAFSHCWKLTSVIIPQSVTNIGADAFISCEQLESIVFPDSIKILEEVRLIIHAGMILNL